MRRDAQTNDIAALGALLRSEFETLPFREQQVEICSFYNYIL
jgi:hypothetical protein